MSDNNLPYCSYTLILILSVLVVQSHWLSLANDCTYLKAKCLSKLWFAFARAYAVKRGNTEIHVIFTYAWSIFCIQVKFFQDLDVFVITGRFVSTGGWQYI